MSSSDEWDLDSSILTLDSDGRLQYDGGKLNYDTLTYTNVIKPSATLIEDAISVFDGSTSYFLPANMEPRNHLEQLASQIFEHHVRDAKYDKNQSGAEWWVQVRDGPSSSVGFHWDKDEELCTESSINVHPLISTVTYLQCSSDSNPTVILKQCSSTNYGDEVEVYGSIDTAYISFPLVGKHLSFDGRYLHAAPHDITPKQNTMTTTTRVTFLVNVWLNYIPEALELYDGELLSNNEKTKTKKKKITTQFQTIIPTRNLFDDHKVNTHQYVFGPTNTEHVVEMNIPISLNGKNGETVKLHYEQVAEFRQNHKKSRKK